MSEMNSRPQRKSVSYFGFFFLVWTNNSEDHGGELSRWKYNLVWVQCSWAPIWIETCPSFNTFTLLLLQESLWFEIIWIIPKIWRSMQVIHLNRMKGDRTIIMIIENKAENEEWKHWRASSTHRNEDISSWGDSIAIFVNIVASCKYR